MKLLMILSLAVLTGCTTVHDLGNGQYLVPQSTDKPQPGTNVAWTWIDRCTGTIDPNKWGIQYSNCERVTEYQVVSSPGWIAQVIQGVATISGFATLGAIMPATSVTTNAVSNTSTILKSPGGHGHK